MLPESRMWLPTDGNGVQSNPEVLSPLGGTYLLACDYARLLPPCRDLIRGRHDWSQWSTRLPAASQNPHFHYFYIGHLMPKLSTIFFGLT